MAGEDLEWAELLQRVLDARAAEILTAIPGVIVSYDSTKQAADILPVVRRALTDENDKIVHEDLPIVPNVPILFPSGGGYSVTWPLVKGDPVDLIVQTYAFAQWRQANEVSDPGDLRLHSLGNCMAIPGGRPNATLIPNTQAGANAYIIEGPEIRLGADATDFVALASKVLAELTEIKAAISAAATTPGDGGAAFKAAILSHLTAHTFPNSVAATKAKAK